MGPGAERNPLCPPITHFLPEPQVGLCPSHLQIPQEGWDMCFIPLGLEEGHDLLSALPQAGEGWNRTPVLLTLLPLIMLI